MFFHRLYILPCRYRYTIHEYWSSWHCCHIQEKKHCIRQHLKKEHISLNCNIERTKGVLTGPLVRFLFAWYKEKFQTFYPPACNLSLCFTNFYEALYKCSSNKSVILLCGVILKRIQLCMCSKWER